MTRKEMPPATWLRAILEDEDPSRVSDVPLRFEPPEPQPPECKRSFITRLIARALGRTSTGD